MQELRGRFLIKGKRLNKLEASFAEEASAGEDTDVTEEEESGSDSENDEEPKETKVREIQTALLVQCSCARFKCDSFLVE